LCGKFKYIIIDTGGKLKVGIAPDFTLFEHIDIYKNISNDGKVVSGGFLKMTPGSLFLESEIVAYGNSISLGVKSRQEDGELLKLLFPMLDKLYKDIFKNASNGLIRTKCIDKEELNDKS